MFIGVCSVGTGLGQPANDLFENATLISGAGGTTTGSNDEATRQSGEPDHPENAGGASVWWRWTAPDDAMSTFDTFGSDIDTIMAVYTGDDLTGLTLVAENDDVGESLQSRVIFRATGGTTYSIAVDGYDGIGGNIVLNWISQIGTPPNDLFENATVLTGPDGTLNGSNVSASKEPGEPDHAGEVGGASVWYCWTVQSNRLYTIDTFGSGFDTVLAVYQGTSVTNLETVTANDDSGDSVQSRVSFTAGAGTTFWIAVDGYQGQQGSVVLNRSSAPAPQPPANDLFSGARVIAGNEGSLLDKSDLAGKEPAEPNHAGNPGGRSLWYRWTAPQDGLVTFETQDSRFDTLLAVYTGDSLDTLQEVAANDNGLFDVDYSRVGFVATAGMIYSIAVDGHHEEGHRAEGGTLVLSWYYGDTAPVRDILPDLSVLADPDSEFLYGWYLDSDEIPGRTLLRLTTTIPNLGRGPLELHATGTDAEVYQRIYRSDGSTRERLAGTFTFHPGHGHLHFDNFLQFHLRSTNGGVGPIVASGEKISFAVVDFDVYDLTLPGAPNEGQYSAGLVQGISVGWADIYDAALQDQWIDITDVPPGDYWLDTVVDPEDRILESHEDNNLTRIRVTLPAGSPPIIPPNNDFTNAVILQGMAGMVAAENIIADKELDEPSHAGDPGGHSIWYSWTAPVDGNVVFDTRGSSFDTLLGIYTGDSLAGLNRVTDNASVDPPGLLFSEASFPALAGENYRIAVDGSLGRRGQIFLNWRLTPTVTTMRMRRIGVVDDMVQIDVDVGIDDLPGAFELHRSNSVNGPYTRDEAATLNESAPGKLQVTTALSAPTEFFRLVKP